MSFSSTFEKVKYCLHIRQYFLPHATLLKEKDGMKFYVKHDRGLSTYFIYLPSTDEVIGYQEILFSGAEGESYMKPSYSKLASDLFQLSMDTWRKAA